MNIEAKRKAFVRRVVIATRAALLKHQAEVNEATEEGLRRLDGLRAWAEDGAELPEWVTRGGSLHEQIDRSFCEPPSPELKRLRRAWRRLGGVLGNLGNLGDVVADAGLYASGHFEIMRSPMRAVFTTLESFADQEEVYRGPLLAARQALREASRAA